MDSGKKPKQSVPSSEVEERRLQALLRQHEVIGERIIDLVLKSNAEAERLSRALEQRRKGPGRLIEFPGR